ncbi:hypothetical protein [Pseudomonas alkylphenolica]|uniref:hypothetical protein n=1 Tax=Pseudomonas alkylphenolica TaxID=237609 RepID=UPI0013E38103|nr:hypothetical protein [Pseudomonas alkylphenolica]
MSEIVRGAVASNNAMPEDVAEILMLDSSNHVRACLAQRKVYAKITTPCQQSRSGSWH